MKTKLSAAPFALFLLFLGLSQTAQAQLTCATFCSSVVPCDYNCYYNGNYQSNCMIYNGVCSRDPDADGIDWAVDNCPKNSNVGQANCDGDSKGDVCDDMNGIFVASGKKIACATDIDTHAGYYTAEVKYQQKYVDTSSCHSADRWNHFTYDSYCTLGYPEDECCAQSCENDTNFSCDDNLCQPPSQYTCNPDTIPF
jgi:hypothetical protein